MQEKVLKEQEMMNALRSKDFFRAAVLAFELKQPFRLLQVDHDSISRLATKTLAPMRTKILFAQK